MTEGWRKVGRAGKESEDATGQSYSYVIGSMASTGMPLTGITSNNTSVVSIGKPNGALTPVTVKADGEATVSFNFSNDAQHFDLPIHVSVVPTLYVTMADGTEDATKWTATVGTNSNAQPLPVGGLKEKDAVTLNYKGQLKVKNVTATTDAKPAAVGHALSASVVGEIVGSDGKAYAADDKDNLPEGVTAVAIIAYVGSATGEASPYTHGLAIAMKDAAAGGSVKWSSSRNDESLTNYTEESPAVNTAQSGLSNSQTSGFDNVSNYPAFYAALHNTITVSDGISAAAPASGTSGWFLPSLYQWNMIVKGLSGQSADLSYSDNNDLTVSSLNTKIEAAGGTGLQSDRYWSSTEYDINSAMGFGASFGGLWYYFKDTNRYVRSAFAF